MTYYGGEIPQSSGFAPFDGVALLNSVLPRSGPMPATMAMPAEQPMGPQSGATIGQPSTEALRQQAAAIIQRCYRWLEAVVPLVPQVSVLVPAMITAVQQYEAQQYVVCLNQVLGVAEAARQLQGAVPGLPPL